MGEEQRRGSILLADIGSVVTKAALLDRAGGQCRVAALGEAPTTLDHPWADVTLGLRDAITQVSVIVGREFFDDAGDLLVDLRSLTSFAQMGGEAPVRGISIALGEPS